MIRFHFRYFRHEPAAHTLIASDYCHLLPLRCHHITPTLPASATLIFLSLPLTPFSPTLPITLTPLMPDIIFATLRY
jgi:hypothetical protein